MNIPWVGPSGMDEVIVSQLVRIVDKGGREWVSKGRRKEKKKMGRGRGVIFVFGVY